MKCAQYLIGVVTSRSCSYHSLSVKFSAAMDSSKMSQVERIDIDDDSTPPLSPERAESAVRDRTGGLPLDDAKKTDPAGDVYCFFPGISTSANGDRGGIGSSADARSGSVTDDDRSKLLAVLIGLSQSPGNASASSNTRVKKDAGLPSAPPAEEEAQQRAPRSSASNGAM